MKIVDTHFHLWDLKANYYPWLTDRITPRSFGDYAAIRKDYRLADFQADIGTLEVIKAVHVQAEIDPADPVRETRWLQALADEHGIPQGIVAFVDLGRDDAESVLEQHAAFPNTRGVRQLIHQYRFDPDVSYPLANPVWRQNFGLLRRFGFSFDLNLYAREMPDAAAFVAEHPDIQFIVGHMGMPSRRDDPALDGWQSGMQALAGYPNVAVKISGFGIAEQDWTAETVQPQFDFLIENFGVGRCTFGSNHPVERLSTGYREFWEGCFKLTAAFSDDERTKLYQTNAERLYRV